MAKLEQLASQLKDAINHAEELAHPGEFRNHLGASLIGAECLRQIWYNFRWISKPTPPGRLQRIFQRGDYQEALIVSWLRRAGLTVHEVDPATGKQFRFSAVNGHYGGSADGIIYPPPTVGINTMLAEFKTHNTRSFSRLVEHGLREAKPRHFDQMCAYAKAFGITHGMYFAVNKNDEDIHIEILELDHANAGDLERKAAHIIAQQTKPGRIKNDPSYHLCRMCEYNRVCYDMETAVQNCRSCKNAVPIEDAKWRCNFYNQTLPDNIIPVGCQEWNSING